MKNRHFLTMTAWKGPYSVPRQTKETDQGEVEYVQNLKSHLFYTFLHCSLQTKHVISLQKGKITQVQHLFFGNLWPKKMFSSFMTTFSYPKIDSFSKKSYSSPWHIMNVPLKNEIEIGLEDNTEFSTF